MVGTRTLARLAELTEGAGAKLVLVGDTRQLPEWTPAAPSGACRTGWGR